MAEKANEKMSDRAKNRRMKINILELELMKQLGVRDRSGERVEEKKAFEFGDEFVRMGELEIVLEEGLGEVPKEFNFVAGESFEF